MDTLFKIIMVVQVLSALLIIVLVLLQHGKGADMGAAFGSGASGSLFGATGSSNFVSKMTGVAAAVFFSCTLALSYIASNRSSVPNTGGGVMDSLSVSKSPVGAVPGANASAPASAPATGSASGSASAAAPATSVAPAAPTGAASSASSASSPAPVAPSAPINQVPK